MVLIFFLGERLHTLQNYYLNIDINHNNDKQTKKTSKLQEIPKMTSFFAIFSKVTLRIVLTSVIIDLFYSFCAQYCELLFIDLVFKRRNTLIPLIIKISVKVKSGRTTQNKGFYTCVTFKQVNKVSNLN